MQAVKGSRYCFTHSPQYGAQRAAARKLGGLRQRAEHGGDPALLPTTLVNLTEVEKVLAYTLAELVPLENSVPRARALIQIYLAAVRGIELGEIEQRLAALEARI